MKARKEERKKKEEKNISKSSELVIFSLSFQSDAQNTFKIPKWPDVPIVSQGGHSGEKGLKKNA